MRIVFTSRIFFLCHFYFVATFLTHSTLAYALARMSSDSDRIAQKSPKYFALVSSVSVLFLLLAQLRSVLGPSKQYKSATRALEIADTVEEMALALAWRLTIRDEERVKKSRGSISAYFAGIFIFLENLITGFGFCSGQYERYPVFLVGAIGLICICLVQSGDRKMPLICGSLMPAIYLFSRPSLSSFACALILLIMPAAIYFFGIAIGDFMSGGFRKVFRKT